MVYEPGIVVTTKADDKRLDLYRVDYWWREGPLIAQSAFRDRIKKQQHERQDKED